MKDSQLVRQVLQNRRWSRAKLADHLQFRSEKTISRWLSGASRVDPDSLERLRALYVQGESRYGDDDDVKYLHLYAGVHVEPGFDPIAALRTTLIQVPNLGPRKHARIEWAYGNSRFYRQDYLLAVAVFGEAAALIRELEPEWAWELEQNQLGARLAAAKAMADDAPARRALLSDAMEVCRRAANRHPGRVEIFNALEVASQLELRRECEFYLRQLIEVTKGAYRDPFYRHNRNSITLAEAPEFAFLRSLPCYRSLCGSAYDRFLGQHRRTVS